MNANTAHYGNVLQLETQKRLAYLAILVLSQRFVRGIFPPRVALFDIDLSALQWFCFRSPY